MSKFGLGRGLADLKAEMGTIPDISILTGAERVVVRSIPLAQISPNPDQPRKTFDDAELNELAASIREKGVLQPILLRSVTGRDYKYEIVAGERRFRAAHIAGLAEIPALVKTLDDANAMEIALIENVQRENLNPIEEAVAYKNLMQACGYELADVARLIGKSESYIRNMMRLDSLPDDVRDMVARGEISASHARTIAVAADPAALAHQIIAEKLNVADTAKRAAAANRRGAGRNRVSTTMNDATRKKLEKSMSDNLGTAVRITERRGGAGQIVISFASRVHLDELIQKLTAKK